MNILIAIKTDIDAKLILDFISNYRWPSTSRFRVVHVLAGNECSTDPKRGCLEKFLNDFVVKVQKRTGVQDVSSVIDDGEPIGAVLRVSDYVDADMVIMGHDPQAPTDHVSVSESLVQLEKCSVIIIRPPLGKDGKAAVPSAAPEEAKV